MAAIVLARRGATVTACDLSAGYVSEAQKRALANEAVIQFAVADCHEMPFSDSSFDLIWGHAILHHLDVATAANEIRRILAPGGTAVFGEPWAGNPVVNLLRHWRRHTADERELDGCDIQVLRNNFAKVNVRTYQWNRYAVIRVS